MTSIMLFYSSILPLFLNLLSHISIFFCFYHTSFFPFFLFISVFEHIIVFHFSLILLFLFLLSGWLAVGGTTGDGIGPVIEIEIEEVITGDRITVRSHFLSSTHCYENLH